MKWSDIDYEKNSIHIQRNVVKITGEDMFNLTQKADRTYASIQGILAEKLSPLTFSGPSFLLDHPQKIHLPSIGKYKTTVFLRISDTDRSMDRIAALLYTQALQVLCNCADEQRDRRLRIPVRLILDDFAAAADSCIPDFGKITSVIRSREISESVILQSLSQLEASYGHNRAMTILNNCDHLLYLGGQDVETARYIATKANKSMTSMSGECGGFAGLVSDAIFGGSDNGGANFPIRKLSSVSQVRPGDIIILLDANGRTDHVLTAASSVMNSKVVKDVTVYNISRYDGNNGGKVKYATSDYIFNDPYNGYRFEAWTRYPD